MPKFSVIIPLIPLHDVELKRLFKILSQEQELIEEVIICRSETPTNKSLRVERKYAKYSRKSKLYVPVVLNSIEGKAWDGTNRNRGIVAAKGDYLAFIDADDNYLDNRLATLARILEDSSIDGVLHSYSDEQLLNAKTNKLCEPGKLEYKGEVSTDLTIPLEQMGKSVKIHHAHLTVRRSRDLELFTSIFPGADTEYCKRLVMNGKYIAYCSAQLSSWNRKRNLRYKIRLLKRKFGLDS